ncbi:MAG: folate-binding protein [Rhodospirillales bacterium]
MTTIRTATLGDRGIIRIEGADRHAFLQGLVSNDVTKATAARAIYAALLTPQGKFLHDFFIAASGDTLLIDCEGERREDLFRRLRLYRLRSKVDLADVTADYRVQVAFGGDCAAAFGLGGDAGAAREAEGGAIFTDPRFAAAGCRAILPAGAAMEALADGPVEPADPVAYDDWRLALGLPDGSRDMLVDKATLLESGFEDLNGVDFDKGCYMGQELTARTKYRGLVKKKLMPVRLSGAAPEAGTPVMSGDREVGEIRSSRGDRAIALIRLDALEEADASLTVDGSEILPETAPWASVQAPA